MLSLMSTCNPRRAACAENYRALPSTRPTPLPKTVDMTLDTRHGTDTFAQDEDLLLI